MNYKIFSSCLSILLSIFFIAKNSLDFSPIRFHCNNYILNTYLYIIISIVIVRIIVLYIDNSKLISSKILDKNTNIIFILFFVFTIGFLLMTMIIDPRKTLLKHLSWLIFVCLIGITMYPIYLFTKMNNIF